jgi:Ribbon-helix-helix protein, copG family
MVSHRTRKVTDTRRNATVGDTHGRRKEDRSDENGTGGTLNRDSAEKVIDMATRTSRPLGTYRPRPGGALQADPDPSREIDQVARVSRDSGVDQDTSEDQERTVRLSVNLSVESAETLRALIRRKGLTITEGIRRAIAVWKFVEDESSKGNQLAVIEADGSIRKVVLL